MVDALGFRAGSTRSGVDKLRPAGAYRNIYSYCESSQRFSFSFALNVGGKIGHLRTYRPFFALLISAALGFKNFQNVVLRVKSIAHS